VTRGLASRLRETSAGGGGLRFGGVWTLLVVGQIALTVTFPVVMVYVSGGFRGQTADIGVPRERMLTASLTRDVGLTAARYAAVVRDVRTALAATPDVGRVTLTSRLPLTWHDWYIYRVDAGGAAPVEAK